MPGTPSDQPPAVIFMKYDVNIGGKNYQLDLGRDGLGLTDACVRMPCATSI